MKPRLSLSSNFSHLQSHDEQLLRLGMLGERYFADDPNTCLLKLRQLAEVLTQLVASNVGIFDRVEESQYELLSRLRDHGILPAEIYQLFGEVRRTGNAAYLNDPDIAARVRFIGTFSRCGRSRSVARGPWPGRRRTRGKSRAGICR